MYGGRIAHRRGFIILFINFLIDSGLHGRRIKIIIIFYQLDGGRLGHRRGFIILFIKFLTQSPRRWARRPPFENNN